MPARSLSASRLVLVTGDIDAGKTSWCAAYAGGHPGCDGVLLKKVYRGRRRVGYDVQRIASGRRVPFARLEGTELSRWRPVERVGGFSICATGKQAANRWLLQALASPARILIVDEIGPLELAGGGLADALPRVLADGRPRRPLILVIRRACLAEAVERFGLRDYRLVDLPRAELSAPGPGCSSRPRRPARAAGPSRPRWRTAHRA